MIMSKSVETIDSMDITDNQKRRIHEKIDESKREFLGNIGDLIDETVNEDLSPYVEHTHKGLNLRITTKENSDEIEAIGEYAGLELVEKSKTNVNSEITWIRFTVE